MPLALGDTTGALRSAQVLDLAERGALSFLAQMILGLVLLPWGEFRLSLQGGSKVYCRGFFLALVFVFSTRKCNTIASSLGKTLRGAYDSRASCADDYLASILSL